MQFKIDENLPVEIAAIFIANGYDTKTVIDQSLQGTADKTLIDICSKEGRVLVTLDTDFSDIRTYPPQDYPGIIVLRLCNQARNHLEGIINSVIPILKREPLEQHLWIVEEGRIRIRGMENR